MPLLGRIEARPEEVFGEVRRCRDADERMDPRWPRERREQHDPPAHARPDQHLRPLHQRIEDRNRVFRPAADGAERGLAARCAVAEIVEAEVSLPAAAAVIREVKGFGAGHVGTEPAEEYDARGRSGEPAVGDGCAILPC